MLCIAKLYNISSLSVSVNYLLTFLWEFVWGNQSFLYDAWTENTGSVTERGDATSQRTVLVRGPERCPSLSAHVVLESQSRQIYNSRVQTRTGDVILC